MATQFDPLHVAQRLEAAGVPKNQADVHASTLAEVIENCVARPVDLEVLTAEFDAKLESRISILEARLTSKIEISEAKLVGMIQACESRMISRIEALRAEIDNLRTELRLVKWMNALTLALVTGMLVKSFVV